MVCILTAATACTLELKELRYYADIHRTSAVCCSSQTSEVLLFLRDVQFRCTVVARKALKPI
eukprot:2112475-Amphidinium_carterae.1